jgi:hypothetical protein
VDATHEQAVRRELSNLLIRGDRAEPRTVALVAVLSALDVVPKVIDVEGLSGRNVRKRAKQVADGDLAAKAVRDSITAAQGAVTAAVLATTTAATATSG